MKKNLLLASFILLGTLLSPSAFAARKKLPPMNEYVGQLMSRMTLQEKIGQLNLMVAGDITTGSTMDTQVAGDIAAGKMGGVFNIKGFDKIKALQDVAIRKSRLGIPLLVGMDVIHGYETIFPIPLALSCSWNEEALRQVGAVSAREASADGINWTFSPMVDVALDARWGRISEGFGEDPYLSGVLGAAMTRGYQQADMSRETIVPKDHIMACLKHFALYGAVEAGKEYNTTDMSKIRMYNQFLPPYKAVVDAGVGSVMSSFNLIDYVPATASHWMMTDVLRKQWNFQGFLVTDYGSIGEILQHGTARNLKEASEQSLLAGTDMDMCSQGFVRFLEQSVKEGKVSEADIDIACRRILEAKYKLGLFEDPYRYCDSKRHKTDIFTAAHRQTARDIAAETFVLLKNDRQLLPLSKQGKIALIGPLADTRSNMSGTWSVAATPDRYSSLRESMEKALDETERNVKIEFAAIDYANTQSISYRFQLDGGVWNTLENSHTVTLLNLSPGTHTLRVESKLPTGQWAGNVKVVTIFVKPTIWQTTTAKVLYVLLALLFIYIVVYVTRTIRSSHRKQRELLGQYLDLMEKYDKEKHLVVAVKAAGADKTAVEVAEKAAEETVVADGQQPLQADSRSVGEESLNEEDQRFMQCVVEFVEQHIDNSDLSVTELAAKLNVSKSGLNRKLKSLLGVAPKEFINKARMNRAVALLHHSDLPVKEIAYRCGFSDQNYFGKCFRAAMGVSPSEYRQKNGL